MHRSLFWSIASDTVSRLKESQSQGGNSRNPSAIHLPLISLVSVVMFIYRHNSHGQLELDWLWICEDTQLSVYPTAIDCNLEFDQGHQKSYFIQAKVKSSVSEVWVP